MASSTVSSASTSGASSASGNNDVYQDKSFRLYVPYVHEKTTTAKVFAVFANLGLGRIGREGGDAVVFTDRTDSKGRAYKSVVVHFKHLFSRGANGAENKRVYEHLAADRDNFITVEHMPAKVMEDGTELPARTWQPRLDRPKITRPSIGFGKQERKAKMMMNNTEEEWGDSVAGATEDEAREAEKVSATADNGEERPESANAVEGITDEEYAAQVLSGN
jgi:hypothetical protein